MISFDNLKVTADSNVTQQTLCYLPECDTMLWWPVVTKLPPSPHFTDIITITETQHFYFF